MGASRKQKSSKGGGQSRPDGELRQSQVITTYGPGALVDLVDDAILIPGLEYWYYGGATDCEVPADDLARSLRARGFKLSEHMPFRTPPVSKSEEQHPGCGIKAVEFPTWFLCTRRSCERLVHKRDTTYKKGRRFHRCTTAAGESRLVPVRFAVACAKGHLEDFPWDWFTHNGSSCDAPELRLIDRGSGDLADVFVKCMNPDCGKSRPMSQAKGGDDQSPLGTCNGHRPWLGAFVTDPNVRERDCEQPRRLLLRTASGSYSSQVESALTIPRTSQLDDELRGFLERHDKRDLNELESLADLAGARRFITVLKRAPEFIAKLSDAELWRKIETYREEVGAQNAMPPPVRETEYLSMTGAELEQLDHRYQGRGEQNRDFYAMKPAPGTCELPAGIDELVLVERLREVRVLTGFTRLGAPVANIYGEFEQDSRRAALAISADWLPASEVRGEGFLVVLDPDALDEWERRDAVIERGKLLKAAWELNFPDYKQRKLAFPGVRFYLLHTLAHMLITQVSLDCGYAASAIQERIYCTPPDYSGPVEMAGILLKTGSSGSEGTLGGLVQQGRKIKHHLREALRRGKLCSHDPVCGRATPNSAPGRALLGAACHGCLFIAECSCERANLYLDRALVVPTMGVKRGDELAFFATPSL